MLMAHAPHHRVNVTDKWHLLLDGLGHEHKDDEVVDDDPPDVEVAHRVRHQVKGWDVAATGREGRLQQAVLLGRGVLWADGEAARGVPAKAVREEHGADVDEYGGHMRAGVEDEGLAEREDAPSQRAVGTHEQNLEKDLVVREEPAVENANPVCPVAKIQEQQVFFLFQKCKEPICN
jgi:hypothetical protein